MVIVKVSWDMKRTLLPLLCALAACSSATTAPTVGREFDLRIHQQALVDGTPFMVEFDSVYGDSRCPRNAVCVQAGEAAVRILVTYATGPDILFDFRMVDRPDSATVLFAQSWFLDFVNLYPVPAVGQPNDPDRRSVRLRLRPALD